MKIWITDKIFREKPYGGIARIWKELAHHLSSYAEVTVAANVSEYDVVFPTYYDAPLPRSYVMVYDVIQSMMPEYFGYSPADMAMLKNSLVVCEKAIAISQTTKRDLLNRVGVIEPENVEVVYPAIDEHECEPVDVNAKKYFLVVGNRTIYKNVEGLYRAFDMYDGDADIVAVGGEEKCKEDAVFLSRHPGRLHKLGNITDGQLATLYKDALALVFPSVYEGFGMPLLEAMTYGCPIIAAKTPTSFEVCGDAAIYVSDEKELSGALSYVGNARSSLIAKGRDRVEMFSREKQVGSLLELIQ